MFSLRFNIITTPCCKGRLTSDARIFADFSKGSAKIPREYVNVYPNFITEKEHDLFVDALEPVFRRKRYEIGHWDSVIENYKESERLDESWSNELRSVVEKIRKSNVLPSDLGPWLPVHAIDLSPDGHIKPHVDSIKFSGKIVAGLSLISTARMVLRCQESASKITLLLPPRSFYVLQGDARYKYTHEIEAPSKESTILWNGVEYHRGRRISLIFRDSLVS